MTSGTNENDFSNRNPTSFLNDSTHSSDLSSTTSSQDFVLVSPPRNVNDSYATDQSSNIHSFDDDDTEDLVFPILHFSKNEGEDSEASSDSFDAIDDSHQLRDDDDVPIQRYSKLRNYKHYQFSFPLSFRVMYIGSDPSDEYKKKIFSKFCDSLSQIFWDEVENTNATADIRLEKRSVVCPVRNRPLQVEYYPDSGVALCEADFTNGSHEKAFEYLRKQFEIIDNDSNLVDLCVVFLPFDYTSFPPDLLPTMKKLQERITLFPVISSSGQKYSKLEREQKRRSIVKKLEENGIDIFMWKSDQILEDPDIMGDSNSRHETVYTKKILTVDEFIKFDSAHVYEDLQLFRARAIDLRNDRLRYERAKRRTQQCDRIAGILRDFIVMCMILYTVYLFVSSVWHYAEWSVIPSEFAQSLQAISRASLKTPNGPHWIDIGNGDFDTQIEVLQESSNYYIFDVVNKKDFYDHAEKDFFEVVVTHNPPQVLGRHSVLDLGNGRYSFDIDTSNAKGDVIIEIRKNGQAVKVFPWYPKKKDKTGEKAKDNTISKKFDNISFLDSFNNAAFDISLKVSNALENALYWSYSSAVYIEDKAIIVLRYAGEQATIAAIVVWESINFWIPYIWGKFVVFSDDYVMRLRYAAKRIKKGAYRMTQYMKDYFNLAEDNR
ncbi:22531_t:CDS:2 [Cetraspora pellucida]|uniref:22531_t:CDS:1 n=1 Tax=Cetraspora pellucida TaxID=1433469 RepID=A0A9N9G3I8_9GLOM|nr:22531_t:CDS:2 [Cetraspora pellucida]